MAYYPSLPDATLIIGGWSSKCNNCGKNTVNFKEHDEVSGYRPASVPQEKGCGTVFTHVTTEYGDTHRPYAEERCPDLTYVPMFGGDGAAVHPSS